MMLRWTAALLAALLVLAGCGGGTDRTKAQVRLVNASSGYAQLDLRVDDQLRQGGVAYGETASYAEVDPGKAASTISAPGSATALLSFTPGVAAKKSYTLLAYGPAGALKQLLLDENQGEPDNNRALLRVVNAAPDVGAVDIYLTASNDPLATAVPVQAGTAVDAVGAYLTLFTGTYRLRVTASGDKTDVRLDVAAVTLSSKQIATLVITPGSGGVLAQALLLNQQGGITRQAATQARVRVATGLTQVEARLGNTQLLAALGIPAVSSYSLVTAGNQSLVVLVGGAPLASSLKQLTPGQDYTLLVHGTTASPLVSWLDDDNAVPSDRSQAKVRLVNGVSGASGSLSMTVDSTPRAVGVEVGRASAYSLQAPTITAQLRVAASSSGTLYSAVDQSFVAGYGYTVFVLGPAEAATGVLRRDR